MWVRYWSNNQLYCTISCCSSSYDWIIHSSYFSNCVYLWLTNRLAVKQSRILESVAKCWRSLSTVKTSRLFFLSWEGDYTGLSLIMFNSSQSMKWVKQCLTYELWVTVCVCIMDKGVSLVMFLYDLFTVIIINISFGFIKWEGHCGVSHELAQILDNYNTFLLLQVLWSSSVTWMSTGESLKSLK